MNIENTLAIGKEDEKGALIIDDTSRNAKAEEALDLMATGSTLVQAADTLNISSDKLRVLIGRNTDYDQKYARIKIYRYIDMMERLISFVDDMPDEVERAQEFKLTKQFDAYKFAIGKYDVHIAKAMESAGLSVNVGNTPGSTIQINVAPMKDSEHKQVGDNTDDVTDI